MPEHPPAGPTPVTGLSRVQLVVDDVATCRSWWTQALGLEVLYEDENAPVAALRNRPGRFVVVLSARPPGSAGAGDRLDHLAFAVPDRATLDGWVAHLDELGIEHPGVTDELGSHSLQLVDPDGTRVELVAHPTDPDPAALTSTQRVQPTDRRHDALDPTQRRASLRCRPVPSPGDPPRGRPDEAVRRRARSGPAAGVGHELARGEAAGAVDERHAERRELLHRPEAAHGHL